MNWTQLIAEQAESTYKATAGLIDAVDGAKLDWKPATGDNWLSTGQLIRHLTTACGFTARAFVTGEWTFEGSGVDPDWKPEGEHDFLPKATHFLAYDTKQEALDALEADRQKLLAALAEAGEDRLAGERSTAPWGGPETTLGSHFLSCLTHLAAHKSQLYYYLKLQGHPVHTGTLWGM